MHNAILAFRDNAARVEQLGGLYKAITALTTSAVDASDLLRAQIVLIVSALDHYIHEVTVAGMIDVLEGRRPPTTAYLGYKVSVGAVAGGFGSGSGWFEAEIRERHSYLSFQQPDKVADAIRLFSDVKLWKEVSVLLGLSEQDTKGRLKLIVDRRNKIAHEADIDPSYPGARWPINEVDVVSAIGFVKRLCEAIQSVIA